MPVVELNEVVEILRNGALIKQSEYGGGIPITRIETIADWNINPERFGYADISEHDFPNHILQDGDILISHINSTKHLGKCAIYKGFPEKLIHGMNLLALRVNNNVACSDYIYRVLCSQEFRRQLPRITKDSVNQSSFTVPNFKTLKIPLPPLKEQKRIAAILDKADAIRRKRQQAIALTDQLLRSVFLDMFGDPVSNPKGWRIISLDQIADIRSGITKGRKTKKQTLTEIPYMRVANVQDGHISLEDVASIAITTDEKKRYKLLKDDILLTEGGDPDKLGRGAVWKAEIDPCIHQNHIFCVRIKNKTEFSPYFLSTLIGSQYGKRYFLKAAKQTTGIATINKTQLKEFPVLVASIDIQEGFERFVQNHQSYIDKYTNLLNEQNVFSNSLAQRAFSGEL